MAAPRLPLTARTPEDGPPLSYRAFVPPAGWHQPPLVLVHGHGRGANRQFRAFLPTAIARGVPLIAPVFAPDRFEGYQSLGGADGPLAAMDALLGVLEDALWHLRVPTERVDMLGFSGGAQFVHRFAMLAPSRVLRVVVASAGWYTYLDEDRPFPRGVGASAQSGGRAVDITGFLGIPVHVLVGERDVERDRNLRTGGGIDRRQGHDRLTRALRWMDHLEDEARARNLTPQVTFDLLAGTGHSFSEAVGCGALVERVFDFLYPTETPVAPRADASPADPPAEPMT
jgi:pimeloyl-ACP methyl ester carboxylesterase